MGGMSNPTAIGFVDRASTLDGFANNTTVNPADLNDVMMLQQLLQQIRAAADTRVTRTLLSFGQQLQAMEVPTFWKQVFDSLRNTYSSRIQKDL